MTSGLINKLNKEFFLYLSTQKKVEKFVTSNKFTKKIAKRWIAGNTLEEALDVAQDLNKKGKLTTLDLLGEEIGNIKEASTFVEDYIRILSRIYTKKIKSNISLKPTQMGLALDEEICYQNIEKIVKNAAMFQNFVRIDMEGSAHTQKTIDIFKRLREKYENIGLVIQAYLYRSEDDIKDLLSMGANIRLCKGAYTEPKEIAFPKKKDVDKNYKKLSELLLNSGKRQAFATHDEKMVNHIIEYANKKGIDKDQIEFQMLYGIRKDLQDKIVSQNYDLRIYTPFGKSWYPYTMRRFAESYHNLSFVIKGMFK